MSLHITEYNEKVLTEINSALKDKINLEENQQLLTNNMACCSIICCLRRTWRRPRKCIETQSLTNDSAEMLTLL